MSSLFGGGGPKAKQPTAAMGIDLQSAEYGKCLNVAFGRNKWAGTVIWYGQFKAIKHREKPAGSKGGGAPKQTRFTYTCSYMLALCEGEATVVQVYDGASIVSLSKAGGVGFSGALGQAPWSNLSGNDAVGYSGTATLGFANKDLGDNPSLPNLAFEVNGLAQLNPAGGVYDSDPAAIATAVCTDARVGVSFGALGNLTAWSNYCRAAGLLFSPVYNTQQPALQVLSELLKYSNSEGFYSEGKLKVVPRGDRSLTGNGVTYTPSLTPVADLGANDLITNGSGPAVQLRRKSPADSMNVVRIEFRERAQKYRTVPAIASIDDDVVTTGVRAETSETVDMITSSAVGQLVATNRVNREFYVRNQFEFKTSWRYCYLEPMDVVRLTDPDTGLNLAPVRLLEVSEDDAGLLTFLAEEMPDGVGHAAFLDPQSAAAIGVNPETDPGPVTAPYLFRAPNALVSAGSPEVWVAVAGDHPLWAGCDVYISRDGSSYTYHSTFARESTYGTLNFGLAASADPYTGAAINVSLHGGETLLGCTSQECDDFVTLSLLGDEIIAYQSATLAAGPSYDLGTKIRRGGYGTPIASHSAGSKFVRLDDDILRIPVDASQVGQTIYVKFVSLNAFGRGGRTLDQETAYAYVIGTRSDFPDVPATPTGLAVKGVADGVNVVWSHPNPAAVGATSVEFATASTGPWTVLGQAAAAGTSFHHAFKEGSTFHYRVRSRGHKVSYGWSGYSASASATGTNTSADIANALTTAQNAQATADGAIVSFWQAAAPVIGTGANDAKDGDIWFDTDNGNKVHRVVSGAWQVAADDDMAQALASASSAQATADGKVKTFFSTTQPVAEAVGDLWFNKNTGELRRWNGSTWTVGAVTAPAPSGANLAPNSTFQTGNFGTADAVLLTAGEVVVDGYFLRPAGGGAVPYNTNQYVQWSPAIGIRCHIGAITLANGALTAPQCATSGKIDVEPNAKYVLSFVRTAAYNGTLPTGVVATSRFIVQFFSETGGLVSTAVNSMPRSTDTTSVPTEVTAPANARYATLYLDSLVQNNSGASWTHNDSVAMQTSFKSISFIRKVDLDTFIDNGSVYGRIANWDLFDFEGRRRLGLRIGGTGHRIGDQRNLPQSLVTSYGAVRTAAALSASSTGTITINAHTVRYGGVSVAYSGVNPAVSGLSSGVKYSVYCYDDNHAGGVRTWYATTDHTGVMALGDGVVLAGQITIPASGTSTGGGTIDDCVDANMILPCGTRAGDVEAGQWIWCWDESAENPAIELVKVLHNHTAQQAATRITTESGAWVQASDTTPMTLRDGSVTFIPEMLGEEALVRRDSALLWERVTAVESIGVIEVAHISVGGRCYFAGPTKHASISTHNAIKP